MICKNNAETSRRVRVGFRDHVFWYLSLSLWIRKVGLLAASRYRVSVSRSRLKASHFVHEVRGTVRSSLLCSFGVESEWVHSLDLLVASQEFPIMICWRVACAARECMTLLKLCLRRTTYVLLTRGMRGARMHWFVAMREPISGFTGVFWSPKRGLSLESKNDLQK